MPLLGEVNTFRELIDCGWMVLAAMNGDRWEGSPINFHLPITTNEMEVRMYLLLLPSSCSNEGWAV